MTRRCSTRTCRLRLSAMTRSRCALAVVIAVAVWRVVVILAHGDGRADLLGGRTRKRRGCRGSSVESAAVRLRHVRCPGGLGAVMSASRLFAANGLQLGHPMNWSDCGGDLGGTSFHRRRRHHRRHADRRTDYRGADQRPGAAGVSDIWQYIIKGIVIIGRWRWIAIASRCSDLISLLQQSQERRA